MRGTKAKKIRKYLLTNTQEVLLLIRNKMGDATKNMGPRQIYQHTKKLYQEGKIKV